MSEEAKALGESLFSKLREHSVNPIEFISAKEEFLSNSDKVDAYTTLSCAGTPENVAAFLASLTEEEKAVEVDADTGPQVGDQCPSLAVFNGVTGDPVALAFTAEDPKVYLIEFWATWCGPCKGLMDHNQQMLEHNPEWEGKAEIVCVSVDDDTDTINKRIQERNWNKVTSYLGGPEDSGSATPKLFNVNSIPKYLLVKNGIILWSGHPSTRKLEDDIKKLIETDDINECKALFTGGAAESYNDDAEKYNPLPAEEHKDKMQIAKTNSSRFFGENATPGGFDLVAAYSFSLKPSGASETRKYYAIGSAFTNRKEASDRFIAGISEVFPHYINRIRFEEVSIKRGSTCNLCAKVLEASEIQYLCVHCEPKHYHCEECQNKVREGKGSARLAHPHAVYQIHPGADHLDSLIFVKDRISVSNVYEEEPEDLRHYANCDNKYNPELSCKGPIVGIRFKCAHCPNYDFCQKCGEKWNTEPSEAMVNTARDRGHLQWHVLFIIPFP